ncbi:MAG: Crp/Fnr family transcriptional regulator [uncultured bacterium]|nr:MAG: Crp/Fnr family transcriptional regulator [uncultured bacterium]OGN56901.1 MAG: hypothetical protein A2796_06955 [Chlamydiae bacterium RIFCSPHIGHO2_01_FULL_44_39]OGN59559.1 MAG: hypothetical protein A3D96_07645 [Chlamydiae bacterium RIFCSPHIGHO2_12_FULL_44_59]OGN67305.1 MAG: hypothetical protein A2978_03475 [Chlamydiae bacterium RIFCSPLOWO2_01_FULL_44_52]OGN68725.1 MAG: hypothetical protein A3I67_03205 [Chlamydiae bacterium RIFCSPLOWO2_02_FULL_45_22]OGN69247.1 MAG: hypothetical protein 
MKSLIERAFFLKKTRLFSQLDLEILLAIAEKLHEDDYDKDEKVFTPGQVANRVYMIASGAVAIFSHNSIKELAVGDFFGDESLFNDQPREYTAICASDTILLTLSRSHLLSIISECPSVAVQLLQYYSQKLPCRHIEKSMEIES